jgi:hypothetical protein
MSQKKDLALIGQVFDKNYSAFGLRVGVLRSLTRVPPACSYCVESGPYTLMNSHFFS